MKRQFRAELHEMNRKLSMEYRRTTESKTILFVIELNTKLADSSELAGWMYVDRSTGNSSMNEHLYKTWFGWPHT
jgi:hypothetical protein